MNLRRSAVIAACTLSLGFGALLASGGIGEAAAKSKRSAKSIECSTQADAKGLHGKERRAFRSKCKREKAS